MKFPNYILLLLLCMGVSGTTIRTVSAKPLSYYGAVGDGIADDTKAIKKGLSSIELVLDGEGKSYRVIGTLEVNRDITLKNMKLLQGEKVLSEELMKVSHPRFRQKMITRTLWIRTRNPNQKIKIHLENIFIHRGLDETAGLPSDSAGIWLDGVQGDLNNIEVTGNGPGMGIMIVNSSNVVLDHVHIHDMTWKPWNSDPALDYKVVSKNWNGIPSRELSKKGDEILPGLFFKLERIQEKIAGIFVVKSKQITIQNSSIHHLQARFQDGRLVPYQTDGITVGSNSENINMNQLKLSHVWEGIDLTGNPLNKASVNNSEVSDAHAFGFKMANGARSVTLLNTKAIRCGLSGYVVSGKNNSKHTAPASGNILFNHSIAEDTGSNGYWKDQATIAGFRIMEGRIENPSNVRIENSKAVDNQKVKTMLFGFHEESPATPPNILLNVTSIGHVRKKSRGF